MQVPITQFIPPRGRQEIVHATVPDELAVNYESLRRHNCRLTAEILSTGHVSQCIEHEEGDYAIEICANGPEVQQHLEKMLREFDGVKFEAWLKGFSEEQEGPA